MKKLLTLLLAVTCVCGCSQTQNPTDESKTARIPMVMVDMENSTWIPAMTAP